MDLNLKEQDAQASKSEPDWLLADFIKFPKESKKNAKT